MGFYILWLQGWQRMRVRIISTRVHISVDMRHTKELKCCDGEFTDDLSELFQGEE